MKDQTIGVRENRALQILDYLSAYPGATVADVAAAARRPRRLVAETLHTLEDVGLVHCDRGASARGARGRTALQRYWNADDPQGREHAI